MVVSSAHHSPMWYRLRWGITRCLSETLISSMSGLQSLKTVHRHSWRSDVCQLEVSWHIRWAFQPRKSKGIPPTRAGAKSAAAALRFLPPVCCLLGAPADLREVWEPCHSRALGFHPLPGPLGCAGWPVGPACSRLGWYQSMPSIHRISSSVSHLPGNE